MLVRNSHLALHVDVPIPVPKVKYGSSYLECVAVTAPTGIAASHIGGCTIHAAMGIGAPKLYADFNKMWGKKTPDGDRAIEKLRVLIIDEVSMLSAEMFDCLDAVVRSIR
jgi:ATP-dependent DNA helicase PIF1